MNSGPLQALGPFRSGMKRAFVSVAGKVSKGAKVQLGRNRPVTVPWDFVGASKWYDYEPESTEFFAGLIDKEPESLVADIGCSIGIYSLLALSVSRKTEVYSMDADLMALTIARHMCKGTDAGRHRVVWGFCGDQEMSRGNPLRGDITAGAANSAQRVNAAKLHPRIGANTYTCIDGHEPEGTPFWDVDSLFVPIAKTGRPIILKVDIEGAEIAMVRGAAELANYPNVQILLSVHPNVLTKWNSSAEEVRKILADRGYEISLLEISTEQHWWVRKK